MASDTLGRARYASASGAVFFQGGAGPNRTEYPNASINKNAKELDDNKSHRPAASRALFFGAVLFCFFFCSFIPFFSFFFAFHYRRCCQPQKVSNTDRYANEAILNGNKKHSATSLNIGVPQQVKPAKAN